MLNNQSPNSSSESMNLKCMPEATDCNGFLHQPNSGGSVLHRALSPISEEGPYLDNNNSGASDSGSTESRLRASPSGVYCPESDSCSSQALGNANGHDSQYSRIRDWLLPQTRIPRPPSAAITIASLTYAADLGRSRIPLPPRMESCAASSSTTGLLFAASAAVGEPLPTPRPIKVTRVDSTTESASSQSASPWRPEPSTSAADEAAMENTRRSGSRSPNKISGSIGKTDAYGQEAQPWFNGSMAERRLGCNPFAHYKPTS